VKGIFVISQAVGCQQTRLSGLGERHFDGFPSLVCNIQEDEGWVKGFFVAFQWLQVVNIQG